MNDKPYDEFRLTDPKTIAHRRNAARHSQKMVEQLVKSCPLETTEYSSVILNALLLTMQGITDVLGPVSEEETELALTALPSALESIRVEEQLN